MPQRPGDHYEPGYRRERSPNRGGRPYERNERNERNPRSNRFAPVAAGEPFDLPPSQSRGQLRSRSPSHVRMSLPKHQEPRNEGSFNFRGAAGRERNRPQEPQPEFNFRGPGPKFPSRGPDWDLNSISQKSRAERNGPQESSRGNRGRLRGGMNNRSRGPRRGGFGRPPAHGRDILHSRRASTPEQLAGMNLDGHTRFINMDSSDGEANNDSDVIDLTHDSDHADDDAPRKRAKVGTTAPEISRPQWSNPDPYTSLPPTETQSGPKRDIVKLIRKGEVNGAKGSDSKTAVQSNVDFISLNEDLSEEGEASEDGSVSSNDAIYKAFPSKGRNISEHRQLHAIDSENSGPAFDDEEVIAMFDKGPRGQKRKRGEQSTGAGEILLEWMATRSDPAPWYTIDHSRTANTGLRLHKEICDFYQFVRPTNPEENVRRDLITRVEKAVQRHCHPKRIKVKCFGSFASGMYLPTADMDLVVVSDSFMRDGKPFVYQPNNQKHRLSRSLIEQGVAEPGTVTVVTHAKVPIIKFVDQRTKIKVDISFENKTGLIANETFATWKTQYPAMPPLVLLVKQLLLMRGLNEVFNGGLGGFSIICLVVSMIHNMPEIQSGNMVPEQHYGDLLLRFLDLYGNKFDLRRTGMVMDPPGYFDKIRYPVRKQNADGLTIIDPNKKDNDISGGSRNIKQVFNCFRSAQAAIQRRLAQIDSGKNVQGSILECVLGGNYSSYRFDSELLDI